MSSKSKFSNAPAAAAAVACKKHGGREITVKIVLDDNPSQPFTEGAQVTLTGPIPVPALPSNNYTPVTPTVPDQKAGSVKSNAKGIARFCEVAAGRYAASATHPTWTFIPDATKPQETGELTLLAVDKRMKWGIDSNLVLTDDALAYAKSQKQELAFVGRYLSLDSAKHPMLSLPEAQRYAAHGLDTVALFERDRKQAAEGNVAHEHTAAHRDLDAAIGCLNASGGTGAVIYFTCDFHVSPSMWKGYRKRISEYFKTIANKIHPSRVGVYGSYIVLDHLFKEGHIEWGWQTNFGANADPIHPRANLCQYDIYPDTAGYSFLDASGTSVGPGAGALDLDVVITPGGFGGFRP